MRWASASSWQSRHLSEIAEQLGVTEDTIKGRVKSILAKLDANDWTNAAIIGLKRGIIEL